MMSKETDISMFFDNLIAVAHLQPQEINFGAWVPNEKGYRVVLTEDDKQRLGLQYIVLLETNSPLIWKLKVSLSSKINLDYKKGILISTEQVKRIIEEFLTDKVYVRSDSLIELLFATGIHLTLDVFCSSQEEINKMLGELQEKSIFTTLTARDNIKLQLSKKTFAELFCNSDGEVNSIVFMDSCKNRDKDYITIYARDQKHGGQPCLRIEMKLRTFEKFRNVLECGEGVPTLSQVLTENGLKNGSFNKVRSILRKRFKFEFNEAFMNRIYKQAKRKLRRIKGKLGAILEVGRATRYVVEPVHVDWVLYSERNSNEKPPDI